MCIELQSGVAKGQGTERIYGDSKTARYWVLAEESTEKEGSRKVQENEHLSSLWYLQR